MTTTQAEHLVDLVIEARATVLGAINRPSAENFATDYAAFTAVLDAIQAVTR